MSEEKDLYDLTGAPRTKLWGVLFLIAALSSVYGATIALERQAAKEAIAKLGCHGEVELGLADSAVVDDVELDIYSARACAQAYSVAVTPVWSIGLTPRPSVSLGFPIVINATIGAQDHDVLRSMVASSR